MDFLWLDPLLQEALREDLGRGDVTTEAILADLADQGGAVPVRASVVSRQTCILAGWPVFARVFQLLGEAEAKTEFQEGAQLEPQTIGVLCAHPAVLLRGERVALNLLQRMSGIATRTRAFVQKVSHTRVKLMDTRKTTPLWRDLEKYAVRVGGGSNHRFGLDDGILVKENHIVMAGSIRRAVAACRARSTHLQKIEVEVKNLDELSQAIDAGADVVLLDNMNVKEVREAVRVAHEKCLLEVSGGINAENIVEYAETGVDFISVGALTHSYPVSDLSIVFEGIDSAAFDA